jgi:hypothetical protein
MKAKAGGNTERIPADWLRFTQLMRGCRRGVDDIDVVQLPEDKRHRGWRGETHEWFNLRLDSRNSYGQNTGARGFGLTFVCEVLDSQGDSTEE